MLGHVLVMCAPSLLLSLKTYLEFPLPVTGSLKLRPRGLTCHVNKEGGVRSRGIVKSLSVLWGIEREGEGTQYTSTHYSG